MTTSDISRIVAEIRSACADFDAVNWASIKSWADRLEAIAQQPSNAAPDGYVLVPRKVTNAMIDAYNNVPYGIAGSPPHGQWVWDAMIAAVQAADIQAEY